MLYLAIVVGPRYNLARFQYVHFSVEKIQSIKNLFFQVYHEYKREFKDELVEVVIDPRLLSPERPARSGLHYIRRAEERTDDEFERYLNEPRANENMDGITFFKLHKSRFPIISRMSRDYFAVLSTSAPSEALFSRIGKIVTKKRGRLLSRTIKMLAILKSRGIITAGDMAEDNSDTEEDENSTQLDGDGTTKLRQPIITDILEREDDTGLVTDNDNDNDEEGVIDQVVEFIDNFVE